jgi:serine/threonine-protein kinase
VDLLHAGQIFAQRYRIERFLAQGGMGAVFVGEHMSTEQRVAVKVLWPHVLASKDAVAKFELEARVAGRVQSDHIVRVIDAGYDDETSMPFLVMELLSGKNLDQIVEASGPLSPAHVVTYLRQVAAGLDRAHGYVDKDGAARPIVHRDLKPENLFLATRDNGEPLVKILDFGIAKVVSEGTKASQEIKGTPLFMAFEQASGGPITPRTDIWALGLIVYWLLTGRHYWRAASNPEASMTTLFGEVIAMPLDAPSVRFREAGGEPPFPPAFDAWFARCVARETEHRFRTAGEAIETLAQAFPGLPTSTMMPMSALGPPPAPALASSSPMAQTAGALATTTTTPQRTSRALVAVMAVAALVVVGGGATVVALTRSGGSAAAAQPVTPAPDRATPPESPTQSSSVVTPATAAPPPPTSASATPPPVPAAPPGPGKPVPKTGKPDAPPTPPPATPPPAPPKKPGGGGDVYGER